MKKDTHKLSLQPGLCGDNLLALPQIGVLKGVFLANHLERTDNANELCTKALPAGSGRSGMCVCGGRA